MSRQPSAMRRPRWPAAIVMSLASVPALAQVDQVATPPPNFVLSNYNSAPVGPYGGLEGSAYAARVGDPSAAWFNPAGLARQSAPQLSGSAGVYQRTVVSPTGLPSQGGSIQQLPNFVGFAFSPSSGLTVGAAFLTTIAWDQETDAERITTAASGQQRFAYSADSSFELREGAIGAGYYGGGAWRAGGGLSVSMMNLRLVQSVSDRIATPSGLQSLLVSARASGSAFQLRAQAGAQYDMNRWRLGAAIRTPAIPVYRSGAITFDGVLDEGTRSFGASLFDAAADLEYHLPWEFQGGAAYVTGRVQIEFDLMAYGSIGAYSLLATSQPVVVYGDAGTSVPPTVLTRPFAGLTSASDSVVNVGAGGHVQLFENRNLRLHAGVGSNQSPVAPTDTVFNKVDLSTWSVGLSGSWRRLQFAAGINHQGGHADDVTLRNLLNGEVVSSRVDMSITGFIYSLSYQF